MSIAQSTSVILLLLMLHTHTHTTHNTHTHTTHTHYFSEQIQGIALSKKAATIDKVRPRNILLYHSLLKKSLVHTHSAQCRVLLEKAVKADPTFQQAIIELGRLYLQEGALANSADL